MATCYRHSSRETGVSCSRCERPICPECMTPTSVGMRCPECSGDRTEVRRLDTSGGSMIDQLRRVAPATFVLMAISIGVFLIQLVVGDGPIVAEGALCGTGVGDGGRCGGILSDGGEWYRLVTSAFLHDGIFHVGLNMFVLFLLGRLIEPAIGTPRFLAIYVISLFGGALGALLLTSPETPTIGASGAIYGLFGATILIARNRGLNDIVVQLGFWLGLNLLLTLSVPRISVGGHLGGLIVGVLVAVIVLWGERTDRDTGRPTALEWAIFVTLGAGLMAASLLSAYSVA